MIAEIDPIASAPTTDMPVDPFNCEPGAEPKLDPNLWRHRYALAIAHTLADLPRAELEPLIAWLLITNSSEDVDTAANAARLASLNS